MSDPEKNKLVLDYETPKPAETESWLSLFTGHFIGVLLGMLVVIIPRTIVVQARRSPLEVRDEFNPFLMAFELMFCGVLFGLVQSIIYCIVVKPRSLSRFQVSLKLATVLGAVQMLVAFIFDLYGSDDGDFCLFVLICMALAPVLLGLIANRIRA